MTIGIIGYGNMGSAIAERLKNKYAVIVFDKDASKIPSASGVERACGSADLVRRSDVVILAVKPQDFDGVLRELAGLTEGKLVISIAAGIETKALEALLGRDTAIVRAMPNINARVGKSMTALCCNEKITGEQKHTAEEIFKAIGVVMFVSESQMPAVTAVSGSGPGFFYALIGDRKGKELDEYSKHVFIPALSASAQNIGFSQEQAQLLAAVTSAGSIVLLQETKLSPGELVYQVASKGGTTEAGLKVLARPHYSIDALGAAVSAALRRAEELSRQIKFV